jgi:Mrp family chromosome partitioning ATPase
VRGDGDLVDALDAPVVARIPRDRPVRVPWRRRRRRRRRSRRSPADVPAGAVGDGRDDGAEDATEPGAADALPDGADAAPNLEPTRPDVRHDEVWAAYRRLAVLVEFAQPPRRSFMVVASSDDDGATSVVEHLARELATPGNPVTVVDLGDRADAADVVREGAAGGGYLLVDSPPLLESTEALRLAADVDAVLVVARQGWTTHADLTRTRELLATAGVPPAGSVLLDARG